MPLSQPPRRANPWAEAACGAVVLAALAVVGLYNFLLFHALAEGLTVVAAGALALLVLSARGYLANNYLLVLGLALPWAALVDGLHTLAYQGMGVFDWGGANLPTQLWVAARGLTTAALVAAPLAMGRRLPQALAPAVFGGAAALLLLSIFYWRNFPDCYLPGLGLTPFKIVSEMVFSLALLAALGLLWLRRRLLDQPVARLLAWSLGLMAASELVFTTYSNVYGAANMAGHVLKLAAYYLLYRATVVRSLDHPLRTLFQRLAHERDFVAAVLDTAGALVLVADRNGVVTTFNRAAEEATGRPSAMVLGGLLWALAPPEHEKPLRAAFERAQKTGEVVRLEAGIMGADQSPRLVAWSLTMLPEHDGGHVVATGLDITEQRAAEQAAEAAGVFYRGVLDSLSAHIAIVDAAGEIVDCNRAWREFAQHNDLGEDQIGVNYLDVCDNAAGPDAEDAARAAQGIKEVLSGEARQFEMEYPCHAPDQERWFNLRVTRFHSHDHGEAAVVAHLDVTRRILAEDELAQKASELEESNSELKQYMALTSHDLREPVDTMSSYLGLLDKRHGQALDNDGRDFLDFALDAARRMREQIDALLTYSRITTTRVFITGHDLERLLALAMDALGRPAEEEGRVEWDEGMPGVCGDGGQLARLLANLIANGLKYNKSPEPHVRVSAKAISNGMVLVSVADNGIGIEPAMHERVFEPFQRLHTRSEYSGTGMGLAICRRIVERHGGQMWLDSDSGRGTAMNFTLPAADSGCGQDD